MKITEIKTENISQRENSRSAYNKEDLAELMASIKKHGLLHPIGVKPTGQGGYEVVYGNRRLMAMQKLGWEVVPTVVVDNASTDDERDIMNLVENLKRKNLASFDEGRIYYKLHTESSLSVEEIAARLGLSVGHINNAIRVFRSLPEEFRDKVVATVNRTKNGGKISAASASKALGIAKDSRLNVAQTRSLFNEMLKKSWTDVKLNMVTRQIKMGVSIENAIANSDKVKLVRLQMPLPISSIKKVEKISGLPIAEACVAWLRQMPGFKTAPKFKIKGRRHTDLINAKSLS